MANIKSQIKRIGTNKKAQERNKAVKSELKTAVRNTRKAIAGGDKAAAEAALKAAQPEIARGATKGIMHRNTANRKVSRLAKRVNKLGASASA